VPDNEEIVPWFYRTLRNAAIDQFRRRGAAARAHQAFARELDTHDAPTADMEAEICACVSRLAATLKPEYADALEAIEVGGTPIKTYAETKGLTPNNAAVRVFRARQALKKRVAESCGTCADHGCLNCNCKAR
jgi:RNA polymerase sigma-70 factor (ECF subfamily)